MNILLNRHILLKAAHNHGGGPWRLMQIERGRKFAAETISRGELRTGTAIVSGDRISILRDVLYLYQLMANWFFT